MISKSPIQKLNNGLYIKREDLIPFSFGGNKARKAFGFFKEILNGDYDCVVTYGSSSSNHCRIVSNLAASNNLDCYIVGPQEASEETYNSKMMELFGAEITVVPVNKVHDAIENKLDELRSRGKKSYFIQGGGHGNIGTQAYVDCFNEILEYEKDNQIEFDYIFFASGTGTTQAGLVCGKLINNKNTNIIGISIARNVERGRKVVVDSISDYLNSENISIEKEKIEASTVFIDDYISDGYAKNNSEISRTIDEVLFKYGIPLDSTYTGKAFYGMQDYIEKNNIKGKNILFLHTGGTPLFFDYLNNCRG